MISVLAADAYARSVDEANSAPVQVDLFNEQLVGKLVAQVRAGCSCPAGTSRCSG